MKKRVLVYIPVFILLFILLSAPVNAGFWDWIFNKIRTAGKAYSTGNECTDSDGGINYYKYGVLNFTIPQFPGETLHQYDFCFNSTLLIEYYCTETNEYAEINYKCPNGCKDGACLQQQITQKPDLIVSNINFNFLTTRSPYVAHVEIILTIKNIGNAPLTGSFSVLVSIKDSAGELLASYGSSYSLSLQTNEEKVLPSDEQIFDEYGSYTVSVRVDYNSQVDELNETNNRLDKILDISACTESWSCSEWSSCVNNQQTRTCTDANNCGTTANKPATTQSCTSAQLCTDSDNGRDYNSRGTVYGFCYDCSIVGIGSNSDGCIDTNNLMEFYCINSTGWVRETVNCQYTCKDGACINQTIQTKPDLTVLGITITPSAPKVNENITITTTVKNIGNSAASTLGIVTESNPSPDYIKIYANTGTLLPGELIESKIIVSYNKTDSYQIKSTADAFNSIDELNENNNELTKTITVATTPQACSDDTSYNSCSSTKPVYCDNGNLVNKCSLCGCEEPLICQSDGSCKLGLVDANPPIIYSEKTIVTPTSAMKGTIFTITTGVSDDSSGVNLVKAYIEKGSTVIAEITLYDDSAHGDGAANDGIYGNVWDSKDQIEGTYDIAIYAEDNAGNSLTDDNAASFEIISEQLCKELILGHNNKDADRVNIVFVGSGYTNFDYFKDGITKMIDFESTSGGLMSVEPFKSNKNKFNFWYVDEIGEWNVPRESCEHENLLYSDYFCEDDSLRLLDYCALSNKQYFGVINLGYGGGMAWSGAGILSLPESEGDEEYNEEVTFVHEFGHAFGLLHDEYALYEEKIPDNYYADKNCFIASSKQECEANAPWRYLYGNGCGENGVVDCIRGYNNNIPEPIAICNDPNNNCYTEISCYEGCRYYQYGIFRPNYNTVMRWPSGSWVTSGNWINSYGPYNEDLLSQKLAEYSGG
ncbi:MAG: CARDB domain-containing protein [Candidatus Woesearchaeota archaeon]|nr:CARDB domain-containing protein [Candidatus Woesearchaeota archaeon]